MSKRRSILITLLSVIVVSFASCGAPASNEGPSAKNASDVSRQGGAEARETPQETSGMSAMTACYETKTGEKTLLRSQTFAIDFEPFRNSCFVTSHDPEFKDPPLESEFAIYRNGKKVFDFPDQFNGVTVGCWVEAVAFQDVNNDKLTDTVVVGKCSAKTAPYNENTVYINNGKGFITRADANYLLGELKTIKDIINYIKENPQAFSSTQNAANSDSKS